ncbi:MAG: DUF2177 family protein [Candidatus Pacebacteria bacterium]|nr:DUF2177 family protein [Candidatus Paceibacterota bacterium]
MTSLLQFAWVYLLSVPVFFAIDMVWLGFVARTFYKDQIGHLLAPTVNWPVAISFYLIFLVGLSFFVIVPALAEKNFMKALLYGALFGFFTYATYDLTNWSTLRDWPALVSIVDMLWGTVLSAAVASITYILASYFTR